MTIFRAWIQLRIVWIYWLFMGEWRTFRTMCDMADGYGLCWEDMRPDWWPVRLWGGIEIKEIR
jgi:hypothetical protein